MPPFLNSTRGTSLPALELNVQVNNKLDGKKSLQGLGMKVLLLRTSHLWVRMLGYPWDLIVYEYPSP